jgi:uncharacterized phage protein (TIGR02220 family)
MAENKNSFIFYCDWKKTFKVLPDKKAGQLIKHLLDYVTDENPETDDLLITAVFENIKSTLKRDLIKYRQFIKKQQHNGSLGGRPKNPKEPKEPKPFSENPSKPKKADSVSVNDTVINNTIDHLNDVCNTSYKPTTSETVRLIGGRVGDGYVLNDFKKVIDCMAEKWLDDDEMSQYLRPSTLFRPSKFEGYLQQANRASNSKKHPFADCKCGFNFQLRPNDIEDARKKPCPKCGGKVEIIYA